MLQMQDRRFILKCQKTRFMCAQSIDLVITNLFVTCLPIHFSCNPTNRTRKLAKHHERLSTVVEIQLWYKVFRTTTMETYHLNSLLLVEKHWNTVIKVYLTLLSRSLQSKQIWMHVYMMFIHMFKVKSSWNSQTVGNL